MKHAIATIALACLIATPSLAQGVEEEAPSAPVHFDLGIRAVSLQEVNASDSYDAVFDGDAMTQFGVQFELTLREHFLISLVYETGEVDGHQVLSTDPPIPTTLEETLTLSPIHLTFGWVFAPTSPWHGFVGVGPTLLDWEDEGEAGCPEGQTCDGNDVGYHAAAGLRWSTFNHRFTVGGELRHSIVPDAVGEFGATRLFDEDDLGGTTVAVSLLWRVR